MENCCFHIKEVSIHTCSVFLLFKIGLIFCFSQGVYYQIGDVVSVIDEQDGKPYYAQIRGFIQDQYCEKSAALTWLIPTLASPRDQFDPASYIVGELDRDGQVLEPVYFPYYVKVYSSAWAAVTKYHKLSGLTTEVDCLSSGGCKSNVKVLSGSVSGESCLLACGQPLFGCVLTGTFLHVHALLASLPLLIRSPVLLDESHVLTTLFYLNYLSKGPLSKCYYIRD